MPPCIQRPCYGGPRHTVWRTKPRMVWLLYVEKSLRICITVLKEYQHVTDRRTDRHLITMSLVYYFFGTQCRSQGHDNILNIK